MQTTDHNADDNAATQTMGDNAEDNDNSAADVNAMMQMMR